MEIPVKILPAEETLWGALNAVTAFVDHKQEINGDRYAHILSGSGAALKQKACELALGQLAKKQSALKMSASCSLELQDAAPAVLGYATGEASLAVTPCLFTSPGLSRNISPDLRRT